MFFRGQSIEYRNQFIYSKHVIFNINVNNIQYQLKVGCVVNNHVIKIKILHSKYSKKKKKA